MRIILDTDFGDDIDDTYALYYLLKEAKQDVALILSAFGQTQKRAKLICSFLKKCGWEDINVAAGVEDRAYRDPYMFRFYEEENCSFFENGIEKAKEIIDRFDDVVIISIGPTTNLAALCDVCEKAKDVPVFSMFGSIYRGYFGADHPDKEWNVFADVPSSQKFLRSYKKISIAPLDSCGLIRFEGDAYQKLLASQNPVIEDYKKWLTLGYHQEDGYSSVQYDTQPVYMVLDNQLLQYEVLPLICDDDGFIRIDENGNAVNCALSWKDQTGFLNALLNIYI